MAARSTPAPDLGMCVNHPEQKAVASTDGNGAHELLAYCAACWKRYEATRARIVRG